MPTSGTRLRVGPRIASESGATALGTTVWTGRALQVGFDDLEAIGLALLYPALERKVCSWPLWISARVRSYSRKGPERPVVPPDQGRDGETVSPSPQSNSQTSAGTPWFRQSLRISQ